MGNLRHAGFSAALAVAAAVVSPLGWGATAVHIDSQPGDWIGQGQDVTFTSPATTITATTYGGNSLVSISFAGWYADFEAPDGALAAGNYEGATRYPFNSLREPGLSLTAPGRGCNELSGWYEIHEATFAGSSVLTFAVDFLQSCDGGPALFGAIRINSSVPLARAQPYARAIAAQVAEEGEAVGLSGFGSFDRATSIASYAWAQEAGTPVTLANAGTAQAAFTAPDVAPGGETLQFSLTVTDTAGNSDTVYVEVTVHDASDQRTRAFVDSDVGDWVGQGLTYWYDEATASITTGSLGTVLDVRIEGVEQWNARFALPAGASWGPGMYAGAQRYPFQLSSRPGLSFTGEGRGCNTLTGWFEIVELQVVASTVLRLAVDFVQHCEGGTPALFGVIRINSSVPLDRGAPYAVLPPVAPVTEGEDVLLNGLDSTSRDGDLAYQWTQVGGTAVEIQDADSPLAHFTSPQVEAGGETLTFQLTVTDAAGNTDSQTVAVVIHDSSDPRTRAYIDSPSGDWIGGGAEYTFTAPTSSFTSSVTGTTFVSIRFDGWRAEFEAPAGRSLTAGTFNLATRYPFNSTTEPGLSISSPGRGCNTLQGWFEIYEASYSGSTVVKFAADFLQSCDGGPALFGAVRINSSIPLQQPQPHAQISGPGIVTEGDVVHLNGSLSFDRDDALVSYAWAQTQGTAVPLTGANTPELSFTAPEVAPGGETLEFSLTVTDAAGNTDSDVVTVRVRDVADPRDAAYLKSTAGDWIGQGLTYSYDEANTAFTTTVGQSVQVRIEGVEQWTAQFALPQNGTWEPGTYGFAQRYPFQAPSQPGLSFSGEGRGCNTLSGWFEIIEIEIIGSSVIRLAVDFLQHCEGGASSLFGAIRINSAVPLERGAPYAIASGDIVVPEGEAVVLDGRLSYSASMDPLTYQWTQLSGPPATLATPAAKTTAVDYGAISQTGAAYEFELRVTDSAGMADTDIVRVRVRSRSEPQTYLIVESDGGHYVGQGLRRLFLSDTSQFAVNRNFDNGISVDIQADASWSLDLAAPDNAILQPGAYENAERFPFQAAGRPGLDYYGNGRGCNSVTGRFDVFNVGYETDGAVETAAIDFEHHCEGTTPALRGKLRVNFAPDNEPLANAGPDQDVEELQTVTLDGTSSIDKQGAISYAWRQVSGPALALSGANTSMPQFTAPFVEVGPAEIYTFALKVRDIDGFTDEDTVTVRVLVGVDTDGDGYRDGQDAFPADPAEWADTDGDGTGNNGDAFPEDPQETSDADGDGVGDNGDQYPGDPAESTDTDQDGTGNNADTDDDNDGKPDSTESLAPNGDGNGDGILDSVQANVATFIDNAGAAATIAVAGGTLQSARGLASPGAGPLPSGFTFDRGFFGVDVGVPPGGAAVVTLRLHTGVPPTTYFKYGPVGGGANGYYEFTYNGATGAEVLPGVIVLHLVDGARGDGDGVEDGVITDPGAPAWATNSGGGGGGAMPAGALLLLLGAAVRRRAAQRR